MTIAIDLDTHLASNLTALAQQGVANTNNFAHYANLAFTKAEPGSVHIVNQRKLRGVRPPHSPVTKQLDDGSRDCGSWTGPLPVSLLLSGFRLSRSGCTAHQSLVQPSRQTSRAGC